MQVDWSVYMWRSAVWWQLIQLVCLLRRIGWHRWAKLAPLGKGWPKHLQSKFSSCVQCFLLHKTLCMRKGSWNITRADFLGLFLIFSEEKCATLLTPQKIIVFPGTDKFGPIFLTFIRECPYKQGKKLKDTLKSDHYLVRVVVGIWKWVSELVSSMYFLVPFVWQIVWILGNFGQPYSATWWPWYQLYSVSKETRCKGSAERKW